MIKKIKYILENKLYNLKYNGNIDLDKFKIQENKFSGKKLNIIYLSYHDSTFSVNNTVEPLKELGNLFSFEMTRIPHEKDWYKANKKILLIKKCWSLLRM